MHNCAMSLCLKFFDLTYLKISAGNMNTFERPACHIVNHHADEDIGKISRRDLTAKIQLITPLFSVLPDLF